MILENCTYITPLLTCEKGNIKIKDGCIQAICSNCIHPEPNEEVISGKGKLLIPGLMNLHTTQPCHFLGDMLTIFRFING